ncbi:MAG: Amidohydrolase/deacetylase family metallohydrolase [Dehalococcoidales bacterium]|nr:Amidohydrolase/deacetylase family metallohydrolase [Dehalococcoidales bacterium]
MYSLLIKGGRVIDPAQNLDGKLDVAISRRKIVKIARDISPQESRKVFDATGKIVTPGLIDAHCHVYHGFTRLGADPDVAGVKQGVTTVVDAGSAGQAIFGGFPRYVIPASRTTIYCFLHLGSQGLTITPELRDRKEIDLEAIEATIEANRDLIKGVKLRLVGSVVASAGIEIVKMAKKVAGKFGLPIMVHIGDVDKQVSPTLTRDFLPLMEKGDILAHVFTAQMGGVLRPDGTVLPELKEAIARGMVVDSAHGRFNFSFNVARKAIDQGIVPDTISTDLTVQSLNGPVYSLTVTMSKFMALGFNLKQVIAMTTINAARSISADDIMGSLKPGMPADVSILELLSGTWELTDAQKETIKVSKLLSPSMTVKAGQLIATEPLAPPQSRK